MHEYVNTMRTVSTMWIISVNVEAVYVLRRPVYNIEVHVLCSVRNKEWNIAGERKKKEQLQEKGKSKTNVEVRLAVVMGP